MCGEQYKRLLDKTTADVKAYHVSCLTTLTIYFCQAVHQVETSTWPVCIFRVFGTLCMSGASFYARSDHNMSPAPHPLCLFTPCSPTHIQTCNKAHKGGGPEYEKCMDQKCLPLVSHDIT